MSSLFNISIEQLRLLQALEDRIEGIDFEVEELEVAAKDEIEALKINEQEAKNKIKAYYHYIKMKEGEIQLADDEIKRLQAVKLNREKLISSLKDKVNEALKLFGERGESGNYKLKCDNLSVWNVYHKPLILDEDFNDDRYGRYELKDKVSKDQLNVIIAAIGDIKNEYVPDMNNIKAELKEGVVIEGASLDMNASYVRFK